MPLRFLLTERIPDAGLHMLHDAGEATVLPASPDAAELRALCASGRFDVLLSQLGDAVDAELLETAQLRGVSNYAVGYNNIDLAAAARRGISVANTPGVLTDATADIAMLLILGTARRVIEADGLVRSGGFTGWAPDLMVGSDVSGQVLGLAGFGRIARATARRALGFGVKATQLPWADVVARADFLSLHVPLTPETTHLVDASALKSMKDSAFLINTSRGPVVDEKALVDALRSGVIAGAGLDVYEDEPALAPGLAELPNTVLLPHVGSGTVLVRAKMAELAAANAIAMARGEVPPHPVTLPEG